MELFGDERDIPLDSIVNVFNVEQEFHPEEDEWLEKDIEERGLEEPIKVAELKQRGKYGLIHGTKRSRAITSLHKKHAQVRYHQHLIPHGKIRARVVSLNGADAALEALHDNANKIWQLWPHEIGRHIVEKVYKLGKWTNEAEAVISVAERFHKSEAWGWRQVKAYKKWKSLPEDVKKRTGKRGGLKPGHIDILGELNSEKCNRLVAKIFEELKLNYEDAEFLVNAVKPIESDIEALSEEEAEQRIRKALSHAQNALTSAPVFTSVTVSDLTFMNLCTTKLLSIRRPDCSRAITWVPCPAAWSEKCETPCALKTQQVPLEKCRVKIHIAADEAIFYPALEKELLRSRKSETHS